MLAYVLINVPVRESGNVVKWLREKQGVAEAWAIYGSYDIIAKVDVDDYRALNNLVMETVQGNPQIRSTNTFLVIETI